MTKGSDRRRYSVIEYPLGTLGLVLIGLTAWGVEHLQTRAGIGRIPARVVLAAVAIVGWAVDRLPGRGQVVNCVNSTAERIGRGQVVNT